MLLLAPLLNTEINISFLRFGEDANVRHDLKSNSGSLSRFLAKDPRLLIFTEFLTIYSSKMIIMYVRQLAEWYIERKLKLMFLPLVITFLSG